MSEQVYGASAVFEEYMRTTEQLSLMRGARVGAGGLVADYLQREIRAHEKRLGAMAADRNVQRQALEAGNAALSWYDHFSAASDADVLHRHERIAEHATVARHAAALLVRATAHTKGIAGFLAAVGDQTPALDETQGSTYGTSGVSGQLLYFINTSRPGGMLHHERIPALAGTEGAAKVQDTLDNLAETGVLTASPAGYMISRKPGDPKAASEQLDSVLTADNASELLQFSKLHRRKLGLNATDVLLLERMLDSQPPLDKTADERSGQLAIAFARVRQLFVDPLAVANALEVLPGNDPRHLLLAMFAEQVDLGTHFANWHREFPALKVVLGVGRETPGGATIHSADRSKEGDLDSAARLRSVATEDPDSPLYLP